MKETNKYYDLIDDADLNVTQGYNEMILECPDCGALFGMKACGNRTLFEWFGYHPTDGNCMVVSEKFIKYNSRLVSQCARDNDTRRIRTKKNLDKAITRVEEFHPNRSC